ncbi:MAG: MBL fold metallo-hydrolase [Bacteroidota bacterium]
MIKVAAFVFNGFSENTYLVWNDTKECVIIDPGCSNAFEQQKLTKFIEDSQLQPVRLLNTHCHIDHVLGNAFIAEKYDLELEIHQGELPVLAATPQIAMMYGVNYTPSPQPTAFLAAGDVVEFGDTKLNILFTPGHSPASVSFYCEAEKWVIGGDVLFQNSIGRTDLPGGNMATLLQSIRTKLFPLGDDVVVYSGHGNPTTIGQEKVNNPFLNGQF